MLAPPNGGVATSFSRPGGVYFLDISNGQKRADDFVGGPMRGITWPSIEQAIDDFHFEGVGAAFAELPGSQSVSLNLQQEPCYIAASEDPDHDFDSWCDTDLKRQPEECVAANPCQSRDDNGFRRGVPWDTFLRERRRIFPTYMGHTQFRIHFDGTTNNKQVKWNSGDSTDTQPQLIVRYTP